MNKSVCVGGGGTSTSKTHGTPATSIHFIRKREKPVVV